MLVCLNVWNMCSLRLAPACWAVCLPGLSNCAHNVPGGPPCWWLSLCPPPAKPPDRIWALLQGTNLTVFWRQPEGVWPTLGNYTHMYIIYYRAGSGGVEGSTISGCTNLNCNSAVTGVEADSANYTVTMATVNEDDSLSYRSEATVAVRASEPQELLPPLYIPPALCPCPAVAEVPTMPYQ